MIEADATFMQVFVTLGDMGDGPDLSHDTDQLLSEDRTS